MLPDRKRHRKTERQEDTNTGTHTGTGTIIIMFDCTYPPSPSILMTTGISTMMAKGIISCSCAKLFGQSLLSVCLSVSVCVSVRMHASCKFFTVLTDINKYLCVIVRMRCVMYVCMCVYY